jgi:hypothetical protein
MRGQEPRPGQRREENDAAAERDQLAEADAIGLHGASGL